jgi:hypothetical protein
MRTSISAQLPVSRRRVLSEGRPERRNGLAFSLKREADWSFIHPTGPSLLAGGNCLIQSLATSSSTSTLLHNLRRSLNTIAIILYLESLRVRPPKTARH